MATDPYRAFPKRLELAFRESGRQKQELARFLGTDPARVSTWLSGQFLPRMSTTVKIAEFFNVSVEWLLGQDV